MPGIVSQAVAAGVMPYALSGSFVEVYDWPVISNGPFPDGSYLQGLQGNASRRAWRLQQRLTAARSSALRAFWAARKGRLEAFYFYPVQSQWDPAGVATAGRFLVRFEGALSATGIANRLATDFGLIEVQ